MPTVTRYFTAVDNRDTLIGHFESRDAAVAAALRATEHGTGNFTVVEEEGRHEPGCRTQERIPPLCNCQNNPDFANPAEGGNDYSGNGNGGRR